jgi:signal transduction histidine kinase
MRYVGVRAAAGAMVLMVGALGAVAGSAQAAPALHCEATPLRAILGGTQAVEPVTQGRAGDCATGAAEPSLATPLLSASALTAGTTFDAATPSGNATGGVADLQVLPSPELLDQILAPVDQAIDALPPVSIPLPALPITGLPSLSGVTLDVRAALRALLPTSGVALLSVGVLEAQANGWQNGVEMHEGYEFDLDDSMPCSAVRRDGMLVLPRGTCAHFSGDRYVRDYGLDSYLGVALPGAGDEHVGYVALMSSRAMEPDDDELAVLKIFAARAGAEIERRRHQAVLRTRDHEVAAARARVLDAADSERQRIGRDLHDGAQQRIVALGHLIGIARRKLPDDVPPQARELLDRAHAEARLATDELRELARGLHPAGLTEKGLGSGSPTMATAARTPPAAPAWPA